VFCGAAELSRDTDFAILADAANLERREAARRELQASVIAVPPLSLEHLRRGHAVHFRCRHPEADGLRVDVMSTMRGVAEFPELRERRATLQGADGTIYELMSGAKCPASRGPGGRRASGRGGGGSGPADDPELHG
jgi:hypothetical protein